MHETQRGRVTGAIAGAQNLSWASADVSRRFREQCGDAESSAPFQAHLIPGCVHCKVRGGGCWSF